MKAGLGLILLLFSIALFVSPANALEDMNGDGTRNILDLVLSQNPRIVPGDTNADSRVNIIDLATVGLAYGSQPGDSNWNTNADVANTLDKIDIFDLATVGLNYNRQFPNPDTDPIFSVSPAYSDLKVGENETIDITIQTLPAEAEVYAAELKIYFDPAVLKAESAAEGDFLKQGTSPPASGTFTIINIDNTLGKIEFAITRFGLQSGASGSGTLLTIIISGKSEGQSYLNIDNIMVSDPSLQPVTNITANNGSANVVLSEKPGITQVSDDSNPGSPTNVGQDVTFNIWWTDPDSTLARAYVCDSNNIDSAGCHSREFCSTSNSAANPQVCSYITHESDASQENYWVKVCDNLNVCSDASGPHTFYVNHKPNITVPDQSVDEDSAPPANWIDLWAYTSDPEDPDNTLAFSLTGQTNPGLISCSLSSNRYINCNKPAQDQSGFSDLTVRVQDPKGLSAQDTFRVTVKPVNDLPTQPGVDVTPDNPYTNNDLLCSIVTPSSDADGDGITYSYKWYKNGILQPALNTNTVPSANTARGETWKCRVTPNDGTGDGPFGEDQATVQNSPPTAPAVDVTPDSPLIADDLTCNIATPSQDADGDGIAYSYAWYKNGALQPALNTNTVPAANTAKNQVWKCRVTPNDGTVNGPAGEDQVVVGNTAPVASNLAISPANPKTTDNLVGSYTYSDPDGDPESGSEIRWYRDNVLQNAYNDQTTIPSSATAKGEEWKFTVKPKDGLGFGALKTSPTVTVQNSPPTAPVVDVTPNSPLTTDNLLCTITTPSTDPDLDPVTYSYAWYKNGILQPALNTNTVPAANTANNQVWKCRVTPNDGTGDGPFGEDQATVQNSPPRIDSFSPLADPEINEEADQAFSIIKSDVDGDPLTVKWYLNRQEAGAGDSYTYNSGGHDSQGVYEVKAVVSDGQLQAEHTWQLTVLDTCTRTYLTAGNNIFSLPRSQQRSFNQLNTNCNVVMESGRADLAYYEPNATDLINPSNYRFLNLGDILYPGQGYFVKVENDCYIEMCDGVVEAGDIGYLGTKQVKEGWNLVGAPTYQADFNAGTCQLFGGVGILKYGYNVDSCQDVPGWNGGYEYCTVEGDTSRCRCEVDYYEPGLGYWLRTRNDCSLA